MEFDCVQIGVADVTGGARLYERLLRTTAVAQTSGVVRFQLGRGAVELTAGEPGIRAVGFVPSAAPADSNWSPGSTELNGLRVQFRNAPAHRVSATDRPGEVLGIDHVVVHSPNLDRAVALWRDRFGLRLALDREFPARGLRMLFFRSASVTLEFVASLSAAADDTGPDQWYGIAYEVADLERTAARLQADGVDVSPLRSGHKPGTTVATVRSDTAGVPTLLICKM